MRNLLRRSLSMLLIVGMLSSLASCKKGKNIWDPNAKESSPSASVTVTQAVDEHPYFSGKVVNVFSFSEECPYGYPYVIDLGDCVGIFMEMSVSSADSGPNQVTTYRYQLTIVDYEGAIISELDLSDFIKPDDFFYGVQADYENNIHIFVYPSSAYSAQEVVIDKKGQVIEERHDSVWKNGDSSVSDSDGNTYEISPDPANQQITVKDPDGEMLFSITADIQNESGPLMQLSLYELDDVIYVTKFDELYPIDLESETLGEPIVIEAGRNANPLLLKKGIFFDKADGFYRYDISTQQLRKVISWNDMDIDVTEHSIRNWVPVSDELIIGVGEMSERTALNSGSYGAVELVILTKQATNPNLGREVLILGGFNISNDSDLGAAVHKFNLNNTEYRIEMRDYLDGIVVSEPEGPEYYQSLYSKAAEQFNLDILNGNAPDLLCSGSEGGYFPIERFETQGLLLDLYDLSQGDEAFHKEDYVQSILSLLEVDGKLYRFPMSFSMEGLCGPTRFIGDRSNWTIEEFSEFAKGLPAGAIVFPNKSKADLMRACLTASLPTYVDYSQGLTNFDNPEFYQLLEFVKTYGGEEIDWQSGGDMEDPVGYVNEQELKEKGMLALNYGGILNVADIANYDYSFQEPVTSLGYPSANQAGMVCSVNNTLSVSADCENPEAAWAFISFCISEKSQSENYLFGCAPIHQGVLEKKTYQMLNMPMTNAAWWHMMTEVTQEDVDQFLALVDSISALSGQDEAIMDIVNEEAQAYYEGVKTPGEVAAIIQNRVSTFVSEVS